MPSEPEQPELPVARVVVDVSLAHLDRPFDYAVTPAQDAEAVPGARVRVRFAGKLRDGFVLERAADTDHPGTLAPLYKVVSAEPVLTPEVDRLVRQVADHYAGSYADVLRLAVPPRHAATEKATRVERNPPPPEQVDGPFARYPTGSDFLAALRRGDSPRAAWQLIPSADPAGDWAHGMALAAAATVSGGRGSLLIVPDVRDLQLLRSACERVLGEQGFVALTADLGPAARYRAFLAALRGDVSVVIGTRAAAFAPVRDLGLVALYDDGDDLLAEQRAPYPQAREVLAIRAADAGCAVLFAAYSRSCEVQRMIDRGWLKTLSAERVAVRRTAPRIRIAADTDRALDRDPAAFAARLPHDVFDVIRAGLAAGPVLVQVPRSGYLVSLTCQECREPVRCTHCHGPTRATRRSERGRRPAPESRSTDAAEQDQLQLPTMITDVPDDDDQLAGLGDHRDLPDILLSCRWCGRFLPDWACPNCGSRRWRSPVVGAGRTAEELGRAFPSTTVRQSMGGRVLDQVPETPALVVATPGAEPAADHGYAAAVLLDAQLPLLRADLRAGEEALRRWLNAVALVRPGEQGGSVIAVGDSGGHTLQALVRLDPAGYASRELADRAEAHFPPAVKLITVDGRSAALTEFGQLLKAPDPTEILGPVELGPSAAGDVIVSRLTLRAPLAIGNDLVAAVKAVTATRSAKKAEGALRVQVDPVSIG
ncbi:primosomal protein N' [Microlunatus soli]|uniref:Probable replication restart protein PriA n=1 Tax=Microlunatus soli TaxID=630515 RepID=A0A1H2AJR0_9ACTN|nr:primosomal protein N' [Microlunatus soli]SDT45992.1 replication restart DNA helicase PriA [Microlunatus soli]